MSKSASESKKNKGQGKISYRTPFKNSSRYGTGRINNANFQQNQHYALPRENNSRRESGANEYGYFDNAGFGEYDDEQSDFDCHLSRMRHMNHSDHKHVRHTAPMGYMNHGEHMSHMSDSNHMSHVGGKDKYGGKRRRDGSFSKKQGRISSFLKLQSSNIGIIATSALFLISFFLLCIIEENSANSHGGSMVGVPSMALFRQDLSSSAMVNNGKSNKRVLRTLDVKRQSPQTATAQKSRRLKAENKGKSFTNAGLSPSFCEFPVNADGFLYSEEMADLKENLLKLFEELQVMRESISFAFKDGDGDIGLIYNPKHSFSQEGIRKGLLASLFAEFALDAQINSDTLISYKASQINPPKKMEYRLTEKNAKVKLKDLLSSMLINNDEMAESSLISHLEDAQIDLGEKIEFLINRNIEAYPDYDSENNYEDYMPQKLNRDINVSDTLYFLQNLYNNRHIAEYAEILDYMADSTWHGYLDKDTSYDRFCQLYSSSAGDAKNCGIIQHKGKYYLIAALSQEANAEILFPAIGKLVKSWLYKNSVESDEYAEEYSNDIKEDEARKDGEIDPMSEVEESGAGFELIEDTLEETEFLDIKEGD